MKIGIMSDSHDHLDRIDAAIDAFQARGVREVIHCGDFVSPFAVLPLRNAGFDNFHAVFGNNDGDIRHILAVAGDAGRIHKAPAFVEIAGRKFALLHEPMPHDVMSALPVDVVCYGHTHDKEVVTGSKPLIINPGECCGWLRPRASVAVLDSTTLDVEIIELD